VGADGNNDRAERRGMEMTMLEEGDGAPAPIPHHCEHSLIGWTRC